MQSQRRTLVTAIIVVLLVLSLLIGWKQWWTSHQKIRISQLYSQYSQTTDPDAKKDFALKMAYEFGRLSWAASSKADGFIYNVESCDAWADTAGYQGAENFYYQGFGNFYEAWFYCMTHRAE